VETGEMYGRQTAKSAIGKLTNEWKHSKDGGGVSYVKEALG